MKRTVSSVIAVAASALLLLAGCRDKGLFTLHGTFENGSSDSILVLGLDSRYDRVDTIRPADGAFTWSFRPDTATTLILLLPDGREQPVFADRGIEAEIVIPEADSIVPKVTGSTENDAFYDFAVRSQHDVSFEQTSARIDSFITKDPFSEVTPYLIYAYAIKRWHADRLDIMNLVSRMSGIMQDAPFLVNLMPEIKPDDDRISRYLDRLDVYDTTGVKYDFANLGGNNNYTLICLWASWDRERSLAARRDMDTLTGLFYGRHLALADISIDSNVGSWKDAVRSDTLSWMSYIDHDGWGSRLVRMVPDVELPAYIFLTDTKRFSFKAATIQEVIVQLEKLLPLRSGEVRMLRW